MRAACIDIGSNTTRLLVAECAGGGLVPVHEERAFTRIGRGLSPGGEIAAAKIAEVVAVVTAQLAVARNHGAEAGHGVATAAVRTAANGSELADAIAAATGLEVQIISERDEARLAFRGAVAMAGGTARGTVGVVDVGGGSSEIVVGTAPAQIDWWESLAIGSGKLSERHVSSDPPLGAELDAVRREVEAALADCRPPPVDAAVAVGGSATSVGRLAGPVLDVATLRRALDVLAGAPAAVIGARWDIDVQRVRLLPAGLLILCACAERLGRPLAVGRGGIREGVLLEATA